jgi:uncharacterized protein
MNTIMEKNYKNSNKALLRSILSRQYQPAVPWQKKEFFYKFILRCLWYPQVTIRYIRGLLCFPSFANIVAQQGLVIAKIHRPYLSTHLSISERASAVLSHYQLIEHLPNRSLRELLQTVAPVELASWTGKNTESLRIELNSAEFEREGELMLCLYFQSELIARLSFSFSCIDQQTVMCIGGLQGPGVHCNSEIVRDATKACHGIFPKRIVLDIASLLAKLCGIATIFATGDDSHVFRQLRYRRSKRDKFHASYTDFWLSLGAYRNARGFYQLPTDLPRKNLEDIASKKRAEYRRRYELLDDIHAQVAELTQHKAAVTMIPQS